MAQRKYTGVTRNAEADAPLTLADVSRLPVEVQRAMAESMLDAAEGRVCREHWLASHVEWCGVDDPTLDPAYPPVRDEDDPRDMAWSLLSALDAYDDVPEWDDPDVDTVSLVMERARALALRVTAPEADGAYYSDGSRI